MRVYDDALAGRFEITLSDLNRALNLTETDEQITLDNLNDRINEAFEYYQDKVQFYEGENLLSIGFAGHSTRNLKIGQYVLLDFTLIKNAKPPEAVDISYKVLFDQDPDHLGLLVIEHFWNANLFNNESRVSLIFNPSESRQELSFSNHSRLKGFLGIVKMGTKHIWKGTDHILFIIALILPAAMLRRKDYWEPISEFRPALIYTIKIVTLFTVAHSVTLSIAALGIFDLPSRLVESIIALSIIVTAVDIIFPVFKRKIGWVVFIFGLFHGFGFASVLSDLGVLGENMVLSLFGFNLGVEIGQVILISFIFPVLFFIRKFAFYPQVVMRYGAVAMILVAVFWFVERAFLDNSIAQIVKESLSSFVT